MGQSLGHFQERRRILNFRQFPMLFPQTMFLQHSEKWEENVRSLDTFGKFCPCRKMYVLVSNCKSIHALYIIKSRLFILHMGNIRFKGKVVGKIYPPLKVFYWFGSHHQSIVSWQFGLVVDLAFQKQPKFMASAQKCRVVSFFVKFCFSVIETSNKAY